MSAEKKRREQRRVRTQGAGDTDVVFQAPEPPQRSDCASSAAEAAPSCPSE